jgi:L-threonylcarbamoyladenylate synthase
MQSAVFLDRDGTLIEDGGVLSLPAQCKLLPGVITALQQLQPSYELFVVTNQQGIAEGQVSRQQVDEVNQGLDKTLREHGITIRDWFVCPHRKEDACSCRKPAPGLLLQAAKTYNLALECSFMIGDHPSDACAGEEQGVFGLYLLTGHGKKHLSELPDDKLIFHTLADAATWILAHPDGNQALQNMISQGADALRRGGLVAFPTETVYGLGADALNEAAVRKIYEAKKRPLSNPLIIHIADLSQIEPLVTCFDEQAQRLAEAFWPGPLTLVLPKSSAVPDVVTADLPNVAIRMPAAPLARELIRAAGAPLAAPSANAFGRISPTTACHVEEQLKGAYDVLLDGGACRIGVESTVVALTGSAPRILRPGGITREQIQNVAGPVESAQQTPKTIESPGMLPSHYAPRTPLRICRELTDEYTQAPDVGLLLFQPPAQLPSGPCEILSRSGNIDEAAIHLYAALRRLDALNLRLLVAMPFPEQGIGAAVNDRLKKAANRRGKEE